MQTETELWGMSAKQAGLALSLFQTFVVKSGNADRSLSRNAPHARFPFAGYSSCTSRFDWAGRPRRLAFFDPGGALKGRFALNGGSVTIGSMDLESMPRITPGLSAINSVRFFGVFPAPFMVLS